MFGPYRKPIPLNSKGHVSEQVGENLGSGEPRFLKTAEIIMIRLLMVQQTYGYLWKADRDD